VKEFELQQTQRFSDQLDDVFAFFADPANLVRITPPWLHFSIRSPQPIDMATGALIDYRIRMRGIPMKWRSEITVWDPPHRFVDEQRIGPYRYWIHEHTFKTSGGFTDVSDHVRYAVPGGELVRRLFVARDLRRIFSHRASVLARIFTEIPVTNGARTR
jgi:ligand-binding SRPBCC domain-containing protein